MLKGKGFQEGWRFFKEEVLKAQEKAVSSCPHVPQDKLLGKATDLAEQGALAGTQKKKEGLPLVEGQVT